MTLPSHYVRFGWTQGVCARNSEGEEVDVDSPEACCWCILGAVGIAADKNESINQQAFTSYFMKKWGGISVWNDNPNRTKEEVVALLEEAERALGYRVNGPQEIIEDGANFYGYSNNVE